MAQAKARLTKIISQAVGLVDRPANNRTFITLKNEAGVAEMDNGAAGTTPAPTDGAAPDNAAPGEASARPVAMPQAVKDALTAGVTAALDCLSKVGTMLSSSTVDESASVPVELLMELDQCADGLDELADKWAFEGGPSSMGEATLSAPTDPAMGEPATKAKPPAPPTAGRKMRLLAKKRYAVMESAHKAIEAGHAGIGEGVEKMSALMKELSGESAPASAGGAPAEQPKKDPPVEPDPEVTKKAVAEAVQTALAPVLASLAGVGERLTKVEKAAPAPNAQLEEGGASPPAREAKKPFRQKLAEAKAALGKNQ